MEPMGRRSVTSLVIAGLDPAIHLEKCILRRLMDARVKPGHDESFLNWPPTSQSRMPRILTDSNFKQPHAARRSFAISPRIHASLA
jgi:hypothetical protein